LKRIAGPLTAPSLEAAHLPCGTKIDHSWAYALDRASNSKENKKMMTLLIALVLLSPQHAQALTLKSASDQIQMNSETSIPANAIESATPIDLSSSAWHDSTARPATRTENLAAPKSSRGHALSALPELFAAAGVEANAEDQQASVPLSEIFEAARSEMKTQAASDGPSHGTCCYCVGFDIFGHCIRECMPCP
jgi:hypothetical protein